MRTLLSCVLFFSGILLFAQKISDKEKLQKQNLELKKEIIQLNKQLKKNQQDSKLNVDFVHNLTKKIEVQSKLVNNLSKEKKLLDDDIYTTQLEINKLSRELAGLKQEYKKILIKAYKNKSTANKMLFVLSSTSLNQAYRRIKYLEKYSDYQKAQAQEIMDKQSAIVSAKKQKEKAVNDKEKVLKQQIIFAEGLESERRAKNAAIEEFKKNEGLITAQIREKEALQRQIDSQIRRIIEEEIRLEKLRAEKDRKEWQTALSANTIPAYQKYMSDNPKGDYYTSAQKAIKVIEEDARAWNVARSTHTKASYQAYLKSNPKGSFVTTARTEIEKFEKLEREAEAERQRLIALAKAEEERRLKAQKEEDERKIAAARAEAERAAREKADKEVVTKVPEKEKVVKVDKATPSNEAYEDRTGLGGISGDFASSKGRLRWPVDNGRVVASFGTSSHPILSNISYENLGVDIATNRGAQAKAVFEGEVTAVQQIAGGAKMVLVRHGSFFTAYTNLSSVSVSKGDKVSRGQALGTIDTTDGQTVMNFQVWNGTQRQNPATWVAGM
ncbi:peptidoglycan DD-metalloendopeptidase family protein [Weeksella virosa]|uniref:murein hydrolase activator EnvC family protein n=1 Tax=Weeksella virosa TaxID=1014 RepID=UPI0025572050|nr:peptidoglycan DD-metalloendopeptidase family protein [Weeksella virosa]MDK7374147.1 peptidoglycan DD-metalloendopeptidase family protein [Weeksella virosa]